MEHFDFVSLSKGVFFELMGCKSLAFSLGLSIYSLDSRKIDFRVRNFFFGDLGDRGDFGERSIWSYKKKK